MNSRPLTRCLLRQQSYVAAVRPAASIARRHVATTPPGDAANELIRNRLKNDLKTAMRAKNTTLTTAIKSVLSSITYHEKSAGAAPLSVATLIQRSLKKRKEAADQFRAGGREDLASKEEEECKMLEVYLPQQMTEEELIQAVKAVVAEVGASGVKDLGKVMKVLNSKVDDAVAPRKLVSDVAKRVLQAS
ncbi:hypothetical protein HDU88_001531 [Geranomyces variabilis]|nr:hypothetical protein HDU88_001531 [Geranomyces variabilis]